MPNFKTFIEEYQAKSEPIDTGMDSCRMTLTIHHKDTLQRDLPKGIRVRVFDENGGAYEAKIDDFGTSVHLGVKCGMVSWQLMRDANHVAYQTQDNYQLTDQDENAILALSDGYVLIEANGEKTEDPRHQLAAPLTIFASVNENKIQATYLPPPMLCNLRVRQNERQTKLPDAYLNQIKHYGDSVTFFIHGYNVPLGNLGQFPTAEELGKKPVYFFNAPKPEEVQRPYLHFLADDIEQYMNVKLKAHPLRTKSVDRIPREKYAKQADKKLNGTNALSWYPNVEYYLNLAASGQDELREFTRWEDYSRIVGVTWSGNVDPSMVFFRAEMYANEAGHQFSFILRDLIKQNIRINIITHSLGARVALSALNILGDHPSFHEKIDNLIMWEAAVADNAITTNYTKENNPIAMELFPYAHAAVKHISVVASAEDGVLGGDYDFRRPGIDSFTGLVGGAYPKKYTNLASDSLVLGGGLSALLDYYRHNEVAQYIGQIYQNSYLGQQMHPHSPHARIIKQKIRQLFINEANEINHQAEQHIIPPLTHYNYLKPWSHYRHFYPDILEHIIESFYDTLFNGMATNVGVRQALGFVAGEYTIDKTSKYYDEFISDLFDKRKISFNSQIITIEKKIYPYFLSHSAMRDFEWSHETIQSFRIFDLIYSRTYKRAIMNQIQDHEIGSKFGKYK
ncbi:alpha/beta hydrolase [Rodentibacter genomosp. 2]|uniref:Alpha/beta hydrolase n=1 Tax=Rodentibacter genomosp. 2 TaxID=1908266 RepID=A0A1V3JE83_9PAST|nr:alpha/beta hydrolase [Rodentibacter genomosp. 2]OOF54849.1 hypothetical protein BKK55_08480 [Rodentibacter genomosp. 2]